jgi:hypothetical protein
VFLPGREVDQRFATQLEGRHAVADGLLDAGYLPVDLVAHGAQQLTVILGNHLEVFVDRRCLVHGHRP